VSRTFILELATLEKTFRSYSPWEIVNLGASS